MAKVVSGSCKELTLLQFYNDTCVLTRVTLLALHDHRDCAVSTKVRQCRRDTLNKTVISLGIV